MMFVRRGPLFFRSNHTQTQAKGETLPPSWAPPLIRKPPPPPRTSFKRPARVSEGSGQTLRSAQTPIRFKRLDFDTGVTTLIRSKARVYRSSFLTLRCVPADTVPPPPPSPFPSSSSTNTGSGSEGNVVRFGVMTSKKGVSNFAVERNRARTRFKAVLAEIIKSVEGPSLITPQRVYLAVLEGKIAYGPLEEIKEDVLKGMVALASQSFSSQSPKSTFIRSGSKSTRSANQRRIRGPGPS